MSKFAQIVFVVPEYFNYYWYKFTSDYSFVIELAFEPPNSRKENLNLNSNLNLNLNSNLNMNSNNTNPNKANNSYNLYNTSDSSNTSYPSNSSNSCSTLILKKSVLDERFIVMKERLINIINIYHNRFLNCLDDSQMKDYDPITSKCWHHNFDIQNIPPIPEQKLPEKPIIKKFETVADFVKSNEISLLFIENEDDNEKKENNENNENDENNGLACSGKAGKTKDIFLNLNEVFENQELKKLAEINDIKEPKDPKDTKTESNSDNNKLRNSINFRILEKIRSREKLIKVKREKIQQKLSEHKNDKNKVMNLAIKIHNLFSMQKRKTIELNYLTDNLCESKGDKNKDFFKNEIINLTKIVPDWISLIDTKNGILVKENRDTKFSEVTNKLMNNSSN